MVWIICPQSLPTVPKQFQIPLKHWLFSVSSLSAFGILNCSHWNLSCLPCLLVNMRDKNHFVIHSIFWFTSYFWFLVRLAYFSLQTVLWHFQRNMAGWFLTFTFASSKHPTKLGDQEFFKKTNPLGKKWKRQQKQFLEARKHMGKW